VTVPTQTNWADTGARAPR